jgi:hypothetical protein
MEIHFLEKIPDGKRKKLCCVFKFSRPVQENSGGVLTVKLDYVLKSALVDIIPEEYNRHIFVLEGNGVFQCTCTMYIQCTVYCIMSDNLLKTFYSFLSTKIMVYKFTPNSDPFCKF